MTSSPAGGLLMNLNAGPSSSSTGSSEMVSKDLDTYRSYVATLANKNAKDESKLQAAQALSENFETILSSPGYPAFLDYAIKIFMKILQEGEAFFIAEYHVQSIRKLLLEMIYRMPTNKFIKPHVESLLSLIFRLLEVENETNVLVCLRLIIELHKHFRPAYHPDVILFLHFVKNIYKDLPDRMNKIFEPKKPIMVADLSKLEIDNILSEICSITAVSVIRRDADGNQHRRNYSLIPKAIYSLKVLQELPIIVVLMYELYKENIRQEVDDYIPIIIKTITLQPLKQHRMNPSFNKEIFVDFMGAQIKTLSLLAYIIRTYEDVVENYSQQMVEGMLGMLAISPPEVTHLRKELLIAARHILATKLKLIFVPYIDRLFDEDVLLGRGWTTHESLRPLAYSTLADLVHHVRSHLSMGDLVKTVHLFAKKLHDETIPAAIQSIACKLLHNLVECIKQQSEKDPKQAQIGQDLLMRLLEVFVLKFKTIAKLQLPVLVAKSRQNELPRPGGVGAVPQPASHIPGKDPELEKAPDVNELNRNKFGSTFQVTGVYSVSDLRGLCKTLVFGIKAITWRFKNLKLQLKMKEVLLFIRLVKWFLQAMDIYTITLSPVGAGGVAVGVTGITGGLGGSSGGSGSLAGVQQRPPPQQTVRTKDEKEVLEHFSGIFSFMETQIFREIFSTTIDYMVERIAQNFALLIIGNSFLSNRDTSTVFATVLVEYLLGKMEEMGNGNMERSNLYLKLFKLVFSTVSIFAAESEHMLRPHLHQIVNRSMELAMTAKEPYNYFLLLRTLFRSIGGGNHDLLYQEFLPLLPNLLQGLNSLQSGLHKQHMKDLFVELCLTVPVRLSSLLPYLPMLMDPLVSALNGSHTLISQGLRTLELCVDNLQPDFLYEHIQPVRADLMQALWRSLRNPTDQVAPVAFRVLGKFGGGNRKMMIEPQKLHYTATDAPGPCVVIKFPEHSEHVYLPVGKIIENAVSVMKPGNVELYYRRMAWGVLRDYILASIKFEDDRYTLLKFMHFHGHRTIRSSLQNQQPYKCQDSQARQAQVNALTGMFYSMIIKDLNDQVQPVFEAVIRHYTLISLAQQSGLFSSAKDPTSLDPLVIVDALAVIMGHEEKELCKVGKMVLNLMLETAQTILGSSDLACRLPLFEYLAERMCSLCYERAWYTKLGGCLAIVYLVEMMSTRFIYQHMYVFVKAQLFVMMDLTGEVSSGAIDQAKSNLESLVRLCAKTIKLNIVNNESGVISQILKSEMIDLESELKAELNDSIMNESTITQPSSSSSGRGGGGVNEGGNFRIVGLIDYELKSEVEEEEVNELEIKTEGLTVIEGVSSGTPGGSGVIEPDLASIQSKALNDVSFELIRLVTSPTDLIREQSMHLLRVFAEVQEKSVAEVMEPHKEVLADMIPPKKNVLRLQSANTQIGLMEGNTFCMSLSPRLFKIDQRVPEHEVFFQEVMSLCETSDAILMKMSCYKNIGSLVPLRRSAMRALAAYHYLTGRSDQILSVLFGLLDRPNQELQAAAFQAMRTFIGGTSQLNMTLVHDLMRPLLSTLGDYRNLTLVGARRLSYLVQLFPNSFNEKLCEQLLQHLQNFLETMRNQKGVTKTGDTEKVIVTIIDIFHQIPAAGAKFIEPLASRILQTERSMLIGASSPFRAPLIKFLVCYPAQTINFLLTHIKDEMWSRYLEYLIKHEEGRPFREVLQSNAGVEKLISMSMAASNASDTLTQEEKYELQYQSIRIASLLVKYDSQWIATQHQLATTFIRLWCNDQYLERHKNLESVSHSHWKEPKLLVKVLLAYFTNHPKNIDLLFQILRCFLKDRSLPNFQFVRDFLENTVALNYTIDWKRAAFFRLVELFPLNSAPGSTVLSQELKSKVLQLIVIPCFSASFSRGETQALVGVPPSHMDQSPENITYAFCYKMLDTEQPYSQGDAVRLTLLQLSCLLVDFTLPWLHDSSQSLQGGLKLRKIITYSWPSLHSLNCVDPATKYHGHLVFCHIISKVSLDGTALRKIIQQVLRNLLKAHAIEVRPVVRQALEILIPALPASVPDGYNTLIQLTKRTLIEEGHSMQHLFHIIQLVTRHYSVYYPVRHQILQHMINALQRLGFSASSSMEHKKLSCELGEVIVRWELQRIKDDSHQNSGQESAEPGMKRSAPDDGEQLRKKGPGASGGGGGLTSSNLASSASPGPSAHHPPGAAMSTSSHHLLPTQATTTPSTSSAYRVDPNELKPVEKIHVDSLINFIMRLACTVNEANPIAAGLSGPGEVLSRRCYNLVRTAIKPEVWPGHHLDFRLQWLEKLLLTVDTPEQNLGNISMGLELFTLVLSVMKREHILSTCKAIQKGLNACISSSNNKIIRLTHALLTRLMSIFPTEPSTSNVSSKHEELECIYSSVGRVVFEGVANYENNTDANAGSLFGTIMMLKAACSSNPSYVDRLVIPFVRVIHRMSREHLVSTPPDPSPGTSDLLILSLDLVKNRISAMNSDTKKTFIGSILVALIEKTPEIKVMKAICKMVEEWVKNTKPLAGPSLKEKSILLVKLMQYVEKRFPDLNTQFLELVNFVYRDDAFKATELIPKLESAFLAGLRCTNPGIRGKFFEIFDGSMRRRLHDRLMYIVSSQNWEPMGQHYWIKQCLHLILVTADENFFLQLSSNTPLLESVRSVIENANAYDRSKYIEFPDIKLEPDEVSSELGVLLSYVEGYNSLGDIRNKNQVNAFLLCAAQLCHNDIPLAERVWTDLFPRLWAVLSERQRTSLAGEMLPFIVSGCHVSQKDVHPSAISTLYEGLSLCEPPIQVKPQVMTYMGKSHNLWHRVTLALERLVWEQAGGGGGGGSGGAGFKIKREPDCYDFEPDVNPTQCCVEQLCEMYSQLREDDMWTALWQKHARYKETSIALAYEQQGFFEQALGAWELALGKGRHEFSNTPAPFSLLQEERLWERQWIRCTKELNQWDHLLDYAKTKNHTNPYLILESAWRVPDWKLMKEAVSAVETCCPKELNWKVHLYHGFLAICHLTEQHLPIVKRYVELASSLCMREWRRLPHIVSHIHLPYLQAAQQIMELHEASQIHQGLLHERTNSLHDMKAIVKTWRNRLPIISDDLSHWSDVFTWRQHHYQFITSHYDSPGGRGEQGATAHSTFGVHASAQAIIHFGKIGRKHNLTGVCLDSLSRIYTIPFVPIVDCFQKIRQQVKCYIQMASVNGTKELQEGLEVVESTNLKYFYKEMTSEFYALKGMLLAQIGRYDDANKAFSAAVQFHDTLVKAWALWGDFIESQFTKSASPDIEMGINAIACFLHACRHQNESKARKYLAKVLWLLTYDDAKFSLTEAVEKFVVGVPAFLWLPWIPQLLTGLQRAEGSHLMALLSQVCRSFPQAVYFPTRTLYLTLKWEEMERHKSAEKSQLVGGQTTQGRSSEQIPGPPTLRATPSMLRCSRIMQLQRDIHPTVISSLEGFADQMIVLLRESWHEEVLKHLRQGLAKCYLTAFESRGAVSEATITPHTLQFVKKLVLKIKELEKAATVTSAMSSSTSSSVTNDKNSSSSASGVTVTPGSSTSAPGSELFQKFDRGHPPPKKPAGSVGSAESLARRAQVTKQDPVFQKVKEQFIIDFDFSAPGAMKLQNLIGKLKKWITILEAETKLLPKSFLIEEKCRFLSNFSLQTAEIELPGEFLLPKHSTHNYYVRISRFMPRVEIVQKHNTAARRLYIRGHNGKVYPYLVVNYSGLGDARREERVLQLLRMLNHYLGKQKETSRRFLHMTVPRVVAVSTQMRLVEDNPASVSLLDVYKSSCQMLNLDHDAPIAKYYEKLASVQYRGMQASHQILKDILKEVQTSMIPRTLLRDWALRTYPSPTDYWTFRKMFTLQMSLACFCEYVLHLTRLNPDMLYIHQDSGLLNVSYFKFDVDDAKGELDGNRAVPFRLTPNVQELISEIGVNGPFTASMIASARCFVYPNFKVSSILRAILRDEMIFAHKKQEEVSGTDTGSSGGISPAGGGTETAGEVIVGMVNQSVNSISQRLNSLANFDGTESKAGTLVVAAQSPDYLSCMDPAWHPWL